MTSEPATETRGPAPSEPEAVHPRRFAFMRAAGFIYDVLALSVIWGAAAIPVVILRGGDAVNTGSVWFSGYLLTVSGAYYVYSLWRGGQTLGMRAWRLVLTDVNGRRVGPGRATLRYVVTTGIFLTLAGSGYWLFGPWGLIAGCGDWLVVAWSSDGRSIADRLVGCWMWQMRKAPPRRPAG